ncbi:TPA: ferrous iron transport protein A [Candidatus Bipolaricaulota bacterium]|nr:ferrous iron transport protein A [Candidatus Bipolaricaulota bacterium]
MEVVPLTALEPGELARVFAVSGGRGATRRLAELGLTPGAAVRVLSAARGGPVLVEIRGSRIALGRGMAAKVLVRRGG